MTGRLLPGTAATKGSMLRSGPSMPFLPICPFSLRCSGESCLTLKHSPDPATPVLVDLERPLRARAGSTRLLGSLPPGPRSRRPDSWMLWREAQAPSLGYPAAPHPPKPRPFLLRWKSYLPDPVQVPCFSHPSLAPPLGRR